MAAYHQVYDWVTCGLTAKKPGSASFPMLIIKYEITYLLFDVVLASVIYDELF